ncbi:hypothetical protein [Actinomadura sp. K4S16]|uniref:hypothetical protein n=1 Tax=Actinomadura sp. K4S16 TaxID=1316147 RepID=UPI0011EF170C|nr:hypothetical protein [Actinomadura sp. K4S16]
MPDPSQAPLGGVTIDAKAIYDLAYRGVLQNEQILGQLRAQQTQIDRHQQRLDEMEGRLRMQERTTITRAELDSKSRRTVAAVSAIVGAVGVMVTLFFGLINLTGGSS